MIQPGFNGNLARGPVFGVHYSHHHFKHPTKPGKVTVKHPQKDVPPKTLDSIMKQAGLK